MLNPWVIVALIAAWLASRGAVGLWQRHDGGLAKDVACLADKNAALKSAQSAAAAELNAHIERENTLTSDLDQVGADYATEREKNRVQHDADVDAAYDHGVRLRAPGACIQLPAASKDATAGPVDHGAAICELSAKASADLHGLANDADANTIQLGACQADLLKYSKECRL